MWHLWTTTQAKENTLSMKTKIIKAALWLGLLLCLFWLVFSVDYVGYLIAWLPLIMYMLCILPAYAEKYMLEDIEKVWESIFDEDL